MESPLGVNAVIADNANIAVIANIAANADTPIRPYADTSSPLASRHPCPVPAHSAAGDVGIVGDDSVPGVDPPLHSATFMASYPSTTHP
jgi:hypothetical protein